MTITGAVVLFAVIWFLTLLVALPIGVRTQEEAGEITPGTPASAPDNPRVGRKMLLVTIITVVLWASLCAFIMWSGLTVRDLDFWHRM